MRQEGCVYGCPSRTLCSLLYFVAQRWQSETFFPEALPQIYAQFANIDFISFYGTFFQQRKSFFESIKIYVFLIWNDGAGILLSNFLHCFTN